MDNSDLASARYVRTRRWLQASHDLHDYPSLPNNAEKEAMLATG